MKVYELLSDESIWTKRVEARTISDNPTTYDSIKACKWCLLGALYKCYDARDVIKIEKLLTDYIFYPITTWNDLPSTTYKDVIKLCKELDI